MEDVGAVNRKTCAPCSRNNKVWSGYYSCENCNEQMCGECFGQHRHCPNSEGLSFLKNLSVDSDDGSVGGRKQRTVNDYGVIEQHRHSHPTERCSRHPTELLQMFCGEHDEVCCTVCIALEHKHCYGIVYIKDEAKGVENSKEYSEILRNSKTILKIIEMITNKRKHDRAILETEKNNIKTQINEYRILLKKQIDVLAKISLNELDKRYRAFTDSVDSDIAAAEDMKAKMEMLLTELRNNTNECELFTSVKRGHRLEKEANILEDSISANIGEDKISAETDNYIHEHLCLFNHLVNFIEVNPKEQNTSKQLGKSQIDLSVTGLCYFKEIVRQSLRDEQLNKTCDIADVCCLANGQLILTDKKNYKFWLLDRTCKVQDSLELKGKPSYVCCTADDEIAVAIYGYNYDRYITFFNIDSTINTAKTQSLFLSKPCRGIACKGDRILVSYGGSVLDRSPGRLLVFLRTGAFCGEVKFAQTLLGKPSQIAYGPTSNYIYIIDKNKTTFVVRDSKNEKKFDTQLITPTAMCVDRCGRLFVCGRSCQNIFQLTPSGHIVGKVLTVTCNVTALCYDNFNDHLIVIRSNNTIIGYKIEV